MDDIKVDIRPLIPEGDYDAVLKKYETNRLFNTPKLYLHFEIITPGRGFGETLYRAYRVKDLLGKQGKNGKFLIGNRSELYLTMCKLFEKRKNFRADRVRLKWFSNIVVKVSVRTVTKDYKQRDLPDCCQYSVIDNIKSIEVGTPIS